MRIQNLDALIVNGKEAHFWTQERFRAGVFAADVAGDFLKYYADNGFKENFEYGPLHGTGLIEVEAPWVETSSDYAFKANMCFQIDTFIATDTFGVRWEKGIAISESGFELPSPEIGEIYELDV